jgi:two-component system, cell cycle response regulator DivK
MAMQEPAPSGPTILVAEDSEEQRSLYAAILTGAGYRVVEAADGAQAVALVRSERPRVVLMDVTMPGTSGWNAVRVLRDDPETRDVSIIVVTGLAASWDRDASYAAGADSYLAKPVSPPKLLEEVRKFASR